MENKYESLKGKKCILIFSNDIEEPNDPILRIYYGNKQFKDYYVRNSDLEVQVLDEDAYIYNDSYIDYSKETLGK